MDCRFYCSFDRKIDQNAVQQLNDLRIKLLKRCAPNHMACPDLSRGVYSFYRLDNTSCTIHFERKHSRERTHDLEV